MADTLKLPLFSHPFPFSPPDAPIASFITKKSNNPDVRKQENEEVIVV